MSSSKPLTIQLSLQEALTLETEAKRLNVSPDVLVLQLVKDGIAHLPLPRQDALDALNGLRELARNLPPVDTVALVRASREELEQRGI